MKKLFAVLLFLCTTAAFADVVIPKDTIGVPCTNLTASLTSTAIDLNGWAGVSFQVTSTAGSVATVTVQKRNSPSDAWSNPVITVTNPGVNELGYDGPGIGEIRVVVAYTSGTLNCSVTRTKSNVATSFVQWPTSWVRWDGGTVLSLGYTTIANDDVAVTQRSILNVVGGGCVDNAGTQSTDCTFAGGGGGAPTNAEYATCAANGSLSAEVVAGTGVCTWWATPSSANLASAVTGETGSGALVFGTSPTLTTPTISGAISFPDDTLQTFNPGSTNAGINVGSQAGNPSSLVNGDFWNNSTYRTTMARFGNGTAEVGNSGPSFLIIDDEFMCSNTATNAVGSCLGQVGQISGGSASNPGLESTGVDDIERLGLAEFSGNALNDVAGWAPGNASTMRLLDRARCRFGVYFEALGDTGDAWIVYVGMHNASPTNTTAPDIGAWFSATFANTGAIPTWRMNVNDGGAGTLNVDCAINADDDTWYDNDIWYESGVGVHFLVNNVECTNSPINTTLPTAAADTFRPMNIKFVTTEFTGTTGNVVLDYFKFSVPLSRP